MRVAPKDKILFIFFLTALAFAFMSPFSAQAAEVYKIGAIFAITGPASSLGIPERDTAIMLQEEIDKKGGIKGPDGVLHPVKIIIYDDQSDATEAVKVAKKLLEEGVVAVVGSSQSPTSMALVPIMEKAKVPLISVASSSAIVEPVEERHWIFKTPQSNDPVAEKQVEYLKAKGITRVASLYVNDAFGEDSRKALQRHTQKAGIKIVVEEKFEHPDKDMTAQLTKVKASDAQALIVHAIPPGASIITRQFRDLGFKIPIIHNHGVGNKPFIDLAGGTADGVIFPIGKMLVAEDLPDADPQKKVLLDYIKAYETRFKKPRSTFGGHAWDALQLVFKALEKVKDGTPLEKTRAIIRDEIENTKRFVGTGGVFELSPKDHNGLGVKDMVLVKIVDGKWKYFPREKW